MERQRVLRLLIKEILVCDDKIIIRHCIPLPMAPGDGPTAGSADAALPATQSYLLRSRSQNAALRNAFTCCEEQATVNVTSFEDSLEQINESLVPDATTYAFEE